MKRTFAVSLFVVLGVIWPAASHLLRKGSSAPAPAAAVDAEVGAVLSGGGDFYTKAFTGESVGDPTRGSGSCTAWRRTLGCNPSGPRDVKKDKKCNEVITSDESGFCECGDFAQFATVDCNHRPFTCEVMCLKFAVVTNKHAFFRGKELTHQDAESLLKSVMYGGQQDLEAMKTMGKDVQIHMDRSLETAKRSAKVAKDSMEKFFGSMKKDRAKDVASAQAAMQSYKDLVNQHPFKVMDETGAELIKIGKELQATVNEVLPIDASQIK